MNARSLCKLSLLALAITVAVPVIAQQNFTRTTEYRVDRPDLKSFLEEGSAPILIGKAKDYAYAGKSGSLGRLPPRHLRALTTNSDLIERLLKGRTLVAELNGDSIAEVDLARMRIVAVMAKFDPERIICKETTPLGSRLPVMRCQTVKMAIMEAEAARANADDMVNRLRCIPGEGNPCGN